MCKSRYIMWQNSMCWKSNDRPLPTFPVIGSNRKRNKIIYTYRQKIIQCVMGVTSLGDDLFNPTLTPDGIKCGDNAICMDQKCVNISSLTHIKNCRKDTCLNGGIKYGKMCHQMDLHMQNHISCPLCKQ
ncbi:uncharacterized protein LOC130646169 isoform X2 [Hydractinia symbiolongicarpus]|uniref:uncharacterized protein LOC130646169 isoform X2 n=1 Tax=Hydractinia symbiolongicarpus TaxID=13093 RepID=UPI00254DBFCB|nr:uncharacterized protein LOC130646169 isoform X2 [Hydractinia symbiolongicarpus]XP_057308304.1 uncharacterized protein LOC130646169 isoform X2 [Hydractinia symbiolongicarpus]